MNVILSKHSGFCYGVDNAIKIAHKALKDYPGRDIYMLGELVHNEAVVKKLKQQGVKTIKNIKKIPENARVILSAHGHSPQIYEMANKKKLKVIDATCPKVTKVHILGKILAKKGYFIVIIGDKNHGEVKAIYDQIRRSQKSKACTEPRRSVKSQKSTESIDNIIIIENIAQAKKLKRQSKIGVVSQTTQSVEDFDKIVKVVSRKADEIKIFNTICDATRFRQSSAIDLAKKADLMIVIGSFNSANTKRLAGICGKLVETHQVNSAGELDKKWFDDKKVVGVSAGASTPVWVIEEVVGEIG